MRQVIAVGIATVVVLVLWFAYSRVDAPEGVGFMNDGVRIAAPAPDSIIASPLDVLGEARGIWYFEASFPLRLLDANRTEIAQGYAQARGEWMTEEFVPFAGVIAFTAPATDTGYIVFAKNNPSGLPEHDDAVEIPIRFR
jgi:hypothetical protein